MPLFLRQGLSLTPEVIHLATTAGQTAQSLLISALAL